MKKTQRYTFFLFIIFSILIAGCGSSGRMSGSKKGCGCGVHKGFVGY